MTSSFFHEVRTLYRTTLAADSFDTTDFHGAQNGCDMIRFVQKCKTENPRLRLTLDDCTFTSRSTLIDGTPSTSSIPSALIGYEVQYPSHIAGVILFVECAASEHKLQEYRTELGITFRDHFALTLLCQPTLACLFSPTALEFSDATTIDRSETWIDSICEVFERALLFRGPEGDQWDEGKPTFRAKIRFALPAFPCKSYNQDKVAGVWPDGAEFEALVNIYKFCAALNEVYPPGCVLEVVSDGHVFSDCIGVDDQTVTDYSQKLRQTAILVRQALGCEHLEDAVTFTNLHDILQPHIWTQHLFDQTFAQVEAVQHPIKTARCKQDDLNRGILLASCSADHTQLQHILKNDSTNSMTMLYRGFSRFMLDDLASHPDCKAKSKNQRKRCSEKVALEMMRRNQAYSHLVELAMPRHVRLSIHAHNNKGPKFAVSLLAQEKYSPLTSFDRVRLSADYDQYDEKHHLHIPTPWHNCLVEIAGEDGGYVCKSGLVKAELARSDSAWSSKSGFQADHPRGGRYVLHRRVETRGLVMTPSTPEENEVASV